MENASKLQIVVAAGEPPEEKPDSLGADAESNAALLETLYSELRKLAAAKMSREKPQTLQATALVHEAWMRLGAQQFQNRAHFFAAAAEAMRRILVERARRRSRLKRGGDVEHSELEESQIASPLREDKLLMVHEVLDELAAQEPLKAEIVKLRYFVGLENAEIGALLGVNEKTVRRHWQVAKILLLQMMNE